MQLKVVGVGAVALAVGGCVLGLIGVVLGLSMEQARVAITARGLLAALMVLLLARVLGAWARRGGAAAPVPLVLVAALAGYLLNPLTWNGRALLTQLVADPGLATVLGDGVLWLAVAGLGAAWGASRERAPERVATPYG